VSCITVEEIYERLNRCEQLYSSCNEIIVSRCVGEHCIMIYPNHLLDKYIMAPHDRLQYIEKEIKAEKWPGLCLEDHFKRNNLYQLKVCVKSE
jgi:hypothetical protein